MIVRYEAKETDLPGGADVPDKKERGSRKPVTKHPPPQQGSLAMPAALSYK
jgi:hypothetical protein